MVGNDVLSVIEPESGHLGKDCALPGDDIVKDHVKTADPVGCHHDEGIPVIIDLSYFSCFYRLKFFHFLSPLNWSLKDQNNIHFYTLSCKPK